MTHTLLSSMCYKRNPHLRHVLMQTRAAPLLTQESFLERHTAHWNLLYWWSILRGGYKLSIELEEELHRTESRRGQNEELLMSTPVGGMDSVTSSQPNTWLWRILSTREAHPSPDFSLVSHHWLNYCPCDWTQTPAPVYPEVQLTYSWRGLFEPLWYAVRCGQGACHNRDTPITWEILKG